MLSAAALLSTFKVNLQISGHRPNKSFSLCQQTDDLVTVILHVSTMIQYVNPCPPPPPPHPLNKLRSHTHFYFSANQIT